MRIAITPGDPDGIGPEIVAKVLLSGKFPRPKGLFPVCIGSIDPFKRLGVPIRKVDSLETVPRWNGKELLLLPAPETPSRPPKRPRDFSKAGFQSGWSVEFATRLALSGKVDALVTGPIHKERLQAGGYLYPGHTELLAKLCKRGEVTMMLANEDLRISLVTTHLALQEVPRAITARAIRRTVLQTIESLRLWWGIRQPRVAVCALNPHAGEGGLFGSEESRVISPALQRLRRELQGGALIDGPLPSDTLFAKNHEKPRSVRYDAIVCMYHDQGLIPVKLLDFPRTVNVTLGLPIVRTSVDHGVAFDLVGTDRADPSSFLSALNLACAITKTRKESRK